ncbi:MAG: FKBP-type peptidyl-prolyl cis-trans isomerase [Bacteroidota bacterium]|nr:FKBP-type peptidyl-prolyl cis-trans isomerase [Bacteroidota bacterium]MDP4216107.1 FKBP-type peptidyl-prolyl cis-trans isomerase [Bacteroidota bacterium]MDP4245541.1 FKBP-type peptidyl-prolyl cis-trans isomerase [Bacteroidota bacterium]MDP4256294.1 FKBP-type peptidyl-prolyl cis-trans isomerase [Bacteroidota bacterium]MDP4259733.1 FKBP-type peptidyl-prolyl cis-trans isomerase [Bacteroidota bacterium]
MKNVAFYVIAALVLTVPMACRNQGFKKTKSGLLYKIISDGKGEPAKKGSFLKISVVQKLRDSLLYSSENSMPAYTKVDSVGPTYTPAEVFTMLRKGDSAIVVELADSLEHKFGPLPAFVHKKDKVTISFKVLDVFQTEGAVTDDRAKEEQKEKDREDKTLQDYLASKQIHADKLPEGVYVQVESPGDGPKVDTGKQVAIRYTGKLFPSGKTFESNMTPPAEPFKFVVGRHAVIAGWDFGLQRFKKGGKGTLYIPAYLAYGQQAGPGHKPYETLMFDVVVEDVTDAPPPSANPNMRTMPMRQMPGRPQPQQK